MKNGHLRAVGEVRVSDVSQIDTHSLDAQKAEIGRWCERQGHELVGFYEDAGVSAYKDGIAHRPGLTALLDDARAGKFDIVVVHTLDRLARNVGVLRDVLRRLGESDVGFASVTEGFDYTTPGGKLILTNIVSASEFQSAMTGVHVAEAQRQRVDTGLPAGPVPFGYRAPEPGAVSQPVLDEAEAVLEAFRRRDAGCPYSQAADLLNSQGFKTRDDHRFTAHAMKDIFNNPFYIGVIRYRGDEYPGEHRAIIPDDLFQRVQARRNRRTFQRRVDGERGALQGRIFCVRCGNPLQSDRHRSGKPMYRERHAHECGTNTRSLMSDGVDDQLGVVFGALDVPMDWRERMAKLATKLEGSVDVSKLQGKRRRVVRAFLDDNISEEGYDRRLAVIDAQIQIAQPASMPTVEVAVALFNDLPALWTEATNAERQRLLGPLVDKVYVDVELHQVAAITPAPAFRLLLEGALTRTKHAACLVLSPEQAAKWWRWWRRGRIELPVQRRAGLRYYRCVRRFGLVRWAVAGPASPDRADET